MNIDDQKLIEFSLLPTHQGWSADQNWAFVFLPGQSSQREIRHENIRKKRVNMIIIYNCDYIC